MSDDVQLEDLSRHGVPPSADVNQDNASNGLTDTTVQNDDQTVVFWAWGTSALFFMAAVSLIIFPQFVLFTSETSARAERRALLTPLESFLALHVGILLFAISLALVFNVPPSSTQTSSTPQSVLGHPLLAPLTGACVLIAFISYNTTSVGSLAFLVFLGTATIGVWGVWTMLFAGSSYISNKTGADKRTSSFIFGNKAAASVKKKLWKKEHTKSKLH